MPLAEPQGPGSSPAESKKYFFYIKFAAVPTSGHQIAYYFGRFNIQSKRRLSQFVKQDKNEQYIAKGNGEEK